MMGPPKSHPPVPPELASFGGHDALGVPRSSRFEFRRCLGRGGFGSVYEAFDKRHGTLVAVKVLERAHPDAVLAFKREFRELVDIQHPNLVQLRELIAEGGHWFLSMELVVGSDLASYVRHRDPHDDRERIDERRTRVAFRQLVQALMALHAAGKVHRDVKPSNVRVTPEGRVVLLDFGLVASLRADEGESNIAGTALYMAPEQALGDPLSPAADFYAMGVILFEAITGVPPFEGNGLAIMMAKQKPPKISPCDLVVDAPEGLSELAMLLLQANPEERPRGREILEFLSASSSQRPNLERSGLFASNALHTHSPELVGRTSELQVLERALSRMRSGRLSTTLVLGESGVGKTRLVNTFCETAQVSDEHLLVLRARCYENETVAYKALDGIVDALGRTLRKLPEDVSRALLPPRAGLLPLVFPVLGRVGTISDMSMSTDGAIDRLSLRALVFGALRELLVRLADYRPLVLAIDDLQWADAESIALLAELLRPPAAPALLLICTSRPRSACSEEIQRGLDLIAAADEQGESISLGRLSHQEAVDLALQLMAEPNAPWAEAIAQESEGHPLFVEVLVRHSEETGEAHSLDQALGFYVEALDEEARRLLELCCVAGVPMARTSLLDVADLDAETFASQLGALRVGRLLRTARVGSRDMVEPFHDRVRTATVQRIPPERARKVHRRVALSLEASLDVDRERVAQHWFLAGMPDRAAQAAVLAGDQANEALAFQKAARMYRWAMEIEPELRHKRPMIVKLAEVLANAGLTSEAADLFVEASADTPAGESMELRRRAAELLIQSGRLDVGRAVATELLASVGLSFPKSRAEALRRIVWCSFKRQFVSREFARRRSNEVPHGELARVDVLWSLASTLGPVDHFNGAALQAEHYLYAHAAGEPGRIAQARAMDVFGQIFMGRRQGFEPTLADALALAHESARPDVIGLVHFITGAIRGMCCDWRNALNPLDLSEQVFTTQCTGMAWMLGSCRITHLGALFELGEWEKLAQRFPRAVIETQERGDPYLRAQTLLAVAFAYHLMHDRPDRARAALDHAHAVHATIGAGAYQRWMGELSVGVYNGDLEAAKRCLEFRDQLWEIGSLRMPNLALGARLRIALTAVCLARRGLDASFNLRTAEKERRMLAKGPYEACLAASVLLEAALRDAQGDQEKAIALYEQAEQRSVALGRGLHVDVARVRRAQLIGGDTTAAVTSEVIARLSTAGVRHPLRFLDAMLPGVIDVPS